MKKFGIQHLVLTLESDGRSGNNTLTYNSPSFSGVMFKVGHQQSDSTTAGQAKDMGSYTDFGIQITPEMVDGLTIGYGFC